MREGEARWAAVGVGWTEASVRSDKDRRREGRGGEDIGGEQEVGSGRFGGDFGGEWGSGKDFLGGEAHKESRVSHL